MTTDISLRSRGGAIGRDGFQRIDAQNLGPDGVGEDLGGGHSDPQPGERAWADRNGHQLDVGRQPADLFQQGVRWRGPATGHCVGV